jgi:iron complex transport system permease protein
MVGKRFGLGITLMVVMLPLAAWLSIALGSVPIHLRDVWTGADPTGATIVFSLRLPRCILAFLVGGGLGLAGACCQGLLRNPLADPYVLGVSSGASLGAVIAMLVAPAFLSWFAFGGALITVAGVLLLAQSSREYSSTTLVLAGVIINALFSSAVTFGMLLLGESMAGVMFWLTGAIRPLPYTELGPLAAIWLLVCAALWAYAPRLNVLLLGEEVARSLGVDGQAVRFQVFALASLLIGVLVSKSGIIGFVGLVVPHLARFVCGSDHRWLLPLSVLLGGELTIIADVCARLLGGGEEFPVGVLMAFIGAPFFLWLLWRRSSSEGLYF